MIRNITKYMLVFLVLMPLHTSAMEEEFKISGIGAKPIIEILGIDFSVQPVTHISIEKGIYGTLVAFKNKVVHKSLNIKFMEEQERNVNIENPKTTLEMAGRELHNFLKKISPEGESFNFTYEKSKDSESKKGWYTKVTKESQLLVLKTIEHSQKVDFDDNLFNELARIAKMFRFQ